jgi:divalent metal cation (Fe/Co/Zn/Cd) transporter
MSVERSHEICDRLEAALQKGEGTVIMIHVEPDHEARQASRSG